MSRLKNKLKIRYSVDIWFVTLISVSDVSMEKNNNKNMVNLVIKVYG